VTRISVVVPVFNVEQYLAACLRSVAAQTFGDLEVVVVDDGSTDGSAAIAETFARDDGRFRLVRQANGGLSKARNTGIDAATGEFLAFLDSDDVLPADAYERLLGALDQTGSDFATGNVHRLDGSRTTQAAFLARTFAVTRLRTHVTRFRPLLADRTAWNKLFRRSFWDRHGFRFPEGRIHEDIPVTLPAHFSARSVDVLADPVYYWRVRRTGDEQSITQRRLERRALLDRLQAIEDVRDHLVRNGPRKGLPWYEQSAVADDLRLHLNMLDRADDGYRELFMERAGAFVERAGWGVLRTLPAIDRLKWELVRRGLTDELLEVLRFQREELAATPPVRIRGRWYGDYPFRTGPGLRLPRRVYRLGRSDLDLALTASVDELGRDGDAVVIRGRASIPAVAAAGTPRIRVVAARPGRWQRVRARIAGVRLRTTALPGSAYEARLDPRALRGEGDWELSIALRAGGLGRRRSRFAIEPPRAAAAVTVPAPGGALLTVAGTQWGKLVARVRERWMTVSAARTGDDGELVLSGDLRLDAPAALELRRETDSLTVTASVRVDGAGWTARVPAADLPAGEEPETVWELWAVSGSRRIPLSLLGDASGPLTRTRQGEAALLTDAARAGSHAART